MSRPIPAELLGGPGDGRFIEVDADNLLKVLEFPCLDDTATESDDDAASCAVLGTFGRAVYELREWGEAGARYRYVEPE